MINRKLIIAALFGLSLIGGTFEAGAADTKISDLTAITGANTATADEFAIVDTDVTTTKRITRAELEEAIWQELNATDGGVLLGSGVAAPTAMAVLADGEIIVGDGTTDPVAESGATARTSLGAATLDMYGEESVPGTASSCVGTDSVCIGDTAISGNAAGDLSTVAIGARSTATGVNSIAIGENADATATGSIAIGGNTTDGSSADAGGNNAVAIGISVNADANRAVAIGESAQATALDTVALGRSATASVDQAIAIGYNTDATGTNSIAIGGHVTDASSADASGASAVAIGILSDASGSNSTAIGPTAQATGTQSTALGTTATASNSRTVAIGSTSVSSADRSIAIGNNADATGANCIAIGGNSTDTDSADCSGVKSIALGQHILADDAGENAWAAVEFATQSDTHRSFYHLVIQTTDGTQTELSTDNAAAGATNDISIVSDCTASINITITARRTDADGESATYTRIALFDNDAGTTAIVGAITSVATIEDTAAWDVTLTADDTNDGINVLVTGEAAKTVRWTGIATVVETCG